MIKVLIADDHTLARRGLRDIIEDDKKIAGISLRQGKARRGHIDGFDLEASLPQRCGERTKVFKSYMAEHQGAVRVPLHENSLCALDGF